MKASTVFARFHSAAVAGALVLTGACVTNVHADPVPYARAGNVPPTTALTSAGGEIVAYYYGSNGARFYEQVGMYVNGNLSPAGFVFPNHDTARGTKIDLGFAPAGARIVFALQVFDTREGNYPSGVGTSSAGHEYYVGTPSYTLFSVPSDPADGVANPGGKNQAYITPFTTADVSSAFPETGTYVGFEDLLPDGSAGYPDDYNYTDEQFVFTPSLKLVTPALSLAATISDVTVGSGNVGEFTVQLSAAQTGDVIVNYKVKGTAINGTDYVMLSGKKKIHAGKTHKRIKIMPEGDLEGQPVKVVKMILETGDGYTLATKHKAKVRIEAAN